jgi:hypothetical protein
MLLNNSKRNAKIAEDVLKCTETYYYLFINNLTSGIYSFHRVSLALAGQAEAWRWDRRAGGTAAKGRKARCPELHAIYLAVIAIFNENPNLSTALLRIPLHLFRS